MSGLLYASWRQRVYGQGEMDMRTLYLHCFAGVSFGMLPGALLDLGVMHLEDWQQAIHPLVEGTLAVCRTRKGDIDATGVFVSAADGAAVTAGQMEQRLLAADLPDRAKKVACGALQKLTEAGVADYTPQAAAETLVDLAGTAVLAERLALDFCMASTLAVEPSPCAAAQAILDGYRIPHQTGELAHTRLSPAGAALLAQLVQEYGALPAMRIVKTGYGAGCGGDQQPVLLRAVLGETDDTLFEMELSAEQLFQPAAAEVLV